jgi:ligand-binding sensor domain-containing protein
LGFREIGLCVLALLAATRPAIAVDPRQPADYLRKTFTTQDGLDSNVVNDVLQTREGFLIVGSATGVFRFDGRRFAELNSDPPKSMLIRSLAKAPDGDAGRRRLGCKQVRRLPVSSRGNRSARADVIGLSSWGGTSRYRLVSPFYACGSIVGWYAIWPFLFCKRPLSASRSNPKCPPD